MLSRFGHLMQRVDSLEKTLMLGGIGGRRRRGRQRMRWLDGITDSMDVQMHSCGNYKGRARQAVPPPRPFPPSSRVAFLNKRTPL